MGGGGLRARTGLHFGVIAAEQGQRRVARVPKVVVCVQGAIKRQRDDVRDGGDLKRPQGGKGNAGKGGREKHVNGIANTPWWTSIKNTARNHFRPEVAHSRIRVVGYLRTDHRVAVTKDISLQGIGEPSANIVRSMRAESSSILD